VDGGHTGTRKRGRGFTLVEVLIVMIIIAVLAAIAIPKFVNGQYRAKESSLRHDLQIYRDAVGRFKSDTGLYPASLEDLAETTAPPKGVDSSGAAKAIDSDDFHGPYMDEVKSDPISGSPFAYGANSKPGDVRSSASGSASDGSLYSNW
jgi:general secretion pathway protein G